jgi:hypothetical protein
VVDLPGRYVLRLIVNEGDLKSVPDTVVLYTVNSAPVANAGANQTSRVGDTVVLDGSGSSDVDGDELTYSWSFTSRPSGSNVLLSGAATVSPTFVIDRAGSYTVQLVVRDGKTSSAPDTATITTENSPPVAHAGGNQSRQVGETVTLDGSRSSDPDGDPITYSWSISSRPAGSTAVLSDTRAVRTSLVVDEPGDYVVQLIVNDGKVNSVPATAVITTSNSPPTANAGPNQTRRVGDSVVLDGSASFDADGDELGYHWSFSSRPPGSAAVLADRDTVNPSFVIDAPGEYVVQLVVNDGTQNSAASTVRITTENSSPVAHAGTDQTARIGDTVTLDGSGSFDVDGDPLSFGWNFTSRPIGSNAVLDNRTSVAPTFVLDAPGDFVVRLVVSDGLNLSAPDTVRISTENSAPVANAGPDQSRQVGETVSLNGLGSSDPDGNPLTYAWSFSSKPAGSTAIIANANQSQATFVIDEPGEYVVRLVVNDGRLDSPPDTVRITTRNSKPVANAGIDRAVVAGDLVRLDGRASTDADGDSLTYAWSLISRPAGSTATLMGSTDARAELATDVIGTYVVQLVVNDGSLDSDPDTASIFASDIAGGCLNPPPAPTGVQASDGDFSDRVRVSWERVPGVFEYQVYRSLQDNPVTAVPASGWVDAVFWDDAGAAAPAAPLCGGCGQPALPGNTYYYWVRARNAENCASGLGGPDAGNAGPAAKWWPDLEEAVSEALPWSGFGGIQGPPNGRSGDALVAVLAVIAAGAYGRRRMARRSR